MGAARRGLGVTAGAQRAAAATRPGLGLPAAIFDFSRGKQALLTIAQPALGAVLALAGLPSWRVIAIGLPAACAASRRSPSVPRMAWNTAARGWAPSICSRRITAPWW